MLECRLWSASAIGLLVGFLRPLLQKRPCRTCCNRRRARPEGRADNRISVAAAAASRAGELHDLAVFAPRTGRSLWGTAPNCSRTSRAGRCGGNRRVDREGRDTPRRKSRLPPIRMAQWIAKSGGHPSPNRHPLAGQNRQRRSRAPTLSTGPPIGHLLVSSAARSCAWGGISMRQSIARFGSVAVLALGIALVGLGMANAESIMKECGSEWQAAKAAGTTNGQTWQEFLKSCRVQRQGGAQAPAAAPAAQAAPAPAAPAPTAAAGKTARECNAEYSANKAAIKASRQTKRDFVASCRAGNETMPQGAAAAPAPAPAPAPAQNTGSLFPWQQPASAPAPAPMAPASTATPTGAGQFAAEQQAKYRCPSDTVVWVNNNSGVYHFPGTHNYGHTKEGAYMCEADAKAAGDRAAKNEKHP